MTRDEAFKRAQAKFGLDAVVGVNAQKGGVHYVGARVQGDWTWYGVGSTWEEALSSLKQKKA